MFLSKVEGETICPCLMVWLKKFRVKRFVCCCLFGEWLILGSGYRWYLDTGITVSLILGSGYRWYLDTGIRVSLILGSGYCWYLDIGIWVSLILGLGYHWYSVLGIIDTRFWVSLILGYWYHWYSVWGIIDTRFWVSLILGYWYLGIIDTRVGYLRLCMQYVKITLGWLTHKTSQAPQFFFTGEAHMYPASLNFCSFSWKSLAMKCQCFKATLKLVVLLRTQSAGSSRRSFNFISVSSSLSGRYPMGPASATLRR